MKPKLVAKEAFVLYGLILGFLYGFYLIGLLVGKTHFVEAGAQEESFSVPEIPAQRLEPQLEFYQRLLLPESADPESRHRGSGESPAGRPPAARSQTAPVMEPPQEAGRERYTVQAGAFTAENDARKLLTRLESGGYAARLLEPSSDDRYYRVWVGGFQAEAEALRMEERLRRDGFLTYVKRIPGQ